MQQQIRRISKYITSTCGQLTSPNVTADMHHASHACPRKQINIGISLFHLDSSKRRLRRAIVSAPPRVSMCQEFQKSIRIRVNSKREGDAAKHRRSTAHRSWNERDRGSVTGIRKVEFSTHRLPSTSLPSNEKSSLRFATIRAVHSFIYCSIMNQLMQIKQIPLSFLSVISC